MVCPLGTAGHDFALVNETKEGLLSPATSTDIVRLTWQQTRPSEQHAILALDVTDAYLGVPQPTPVVSRVQGRDLVFLKMVSTRHDPC